MLSMTVQFQDFKSAIAARLAPHLIPSVQQAATAETLIQDFEKRFICRTVGRRRENDGYLSSIARGQRPR